MGMSLNLKLPSARGKKWFMTVISCLVLLAIFGILAYQLTKKEVTVVLDGKKQEVHVHAKTVGGLLKDLDVKVRKHDLVKPGWNTAIRSGMTVRWDPAAQVKFSKNGITESVWTTAKTVGDFLKANHINVGKHEALSPSADASISNGMEVFYTSAFSVRVSVGGKKAETQWSLADGSISVGEFLKKNHISFDDNDQVKPGLNTPIVDMKDKVIRVNHVKVVKDIVKQPIDYAVIKKKDDSLPKGKEKVLSDGQEGLIALHYTYKVVNGERKKEDVRKVKLRDSKARVLAVGTKEIIQPSRGEDVVEPPREKDAVQPPREKDAAQPSHKSVDDSVRKEFYVDSTAYTAHCNGCSGTTSTGINLKAHPDTKVIAVDPNVIPLGSKVWVEGYGYAIAGDTGGAIKGKRIDVFFPTYSKARSWGDRKVLIRMLD